MDQLPRGFRLRIRFALLMTLWLIGLKGYGQVPNDNLAARIKLPVEQAPFPSNTSHCTVEWQCIDKKLAGNCVDFHNDQWFWFSTSRPGRYYVNVSSQRCRDRKGLQLMVIDGVPCKTDTYQVLQCISLGNQDDVYAALDLPLADHPYLVNVDGYLGDFCGFEIQVSRTPKGLPLVTPDPVTVPVSAEKRENRLTVRWQLPPALADRVTGFQVYRWFAKLPTSTLLATLPAAFSSRGGDQLDYQVEDTLREEGRYQYRIVAVTGDSSRMLIGQHWEVYEKPPAAANEEDNNLLLKPDCKPNTPLQILVIDALTDRVLRNIDFTYTGKPFACDVSKFRQQGIYRYKVRVINLKNRRTNEYYFSR
ncbi:MAG: fibronectin type III domain-containing protein [Cytophagales bacterium]|nr:fibronectin type III domain-containing protein [Cytophagales bacterium]